MTRSASRLRALRLADRAAVHSYVAKGPPCPLCGKPMFRATRVVTFLEDDAAGYDDCGDYSGTGGLVLCDVCSQDYAKAPLLIPEERRALCGVPCRCFDTEADPDAPIRYDGPPVAEGEEE